MNKKFRNKMRIMNRGYALVAMILAFALMMGACSDVSKTDPNDSNLSNNTGEQNEQDGTETNGTEMTESSQSTEETSSTTDGETESTDATKETVSSKPSVESTDSVVPELNGTDSAVSFKNVNETVYVTSSVNVRSGPGTANSKVGKLSKGDTVIRTGVGSNGWSRIEYNGGVAYVHSQYLSTKKPNIGTTTEVPDSDSGMTKPDSIHDWFDEEVNERVYVTEKTNVYLAPGTEYEVIGTLNKGDVVTRTSRGRLVGWNRIEYNGQRAYVKSSCLSTRDPFFIAAEAHGFSVGNVITVTDSKGVSYTLQYLGEDRWKDQNGTIWTSYERDDGSLHFTSFSSG